MDQCFGKFITNLALYKLNSSKQDIHLSPPWSFCQVCHYGGSLIFSHLSRRHFQLSANPFLPEQ